MKNLFSIVLFIIFSNGAMAQIGGSSTFSFLQLTNSARLAALGGKNISIPDKDLNFAYDNPASLDTSMSEQLVLNYVNYFAGVNYGYVSYAHKFRKVGITAIGLNYINYGKFIKADETGQITGTFSAFELSLNLFWSKILIDSVLSVGFNLKPIYSKLETYTSFGLALDAGVHYTTKNGLDIGFVINNLGTQLKPYTEGNYEKIPLNIQLGLSQKLEHAPFRFSILYQYLNKWNLTYDLNANPAYSSVSWAKSSPSMSDITIIDNFFRHFIFATELIPSKNFIVMVSYNHQRRKELSLPAHPALVGFAWGVHIRISKFKLSFGQAFYHLAGASKHFSICMNLNELYRKK